MNTVLAFTTLDTLAVVVALAAVGLMVLVFRTTKDPLLRALRSAVVVLMVLLAAGPTLVKHQKDSRPVLAVAVDASPSMVMTGRLKDAIALAHKTVRELNGVRCELYTFAAGARRIATPDDAMKTVYRETTDIGRALGEIRREEGEALSGILLVSDGNNTASSESDEMHSGLDVPVIAIAPGATRATKDLAIETTRCSDFVFKGVPASIVVTVRVSGYAGRQVQTVLKQDGAVIATQQLTATSQNEVREVALPFTPERSGEQNFVVELQPLPEEITTVNNRRTLSLRVVRDRVRVLFICGQPGPEYAFLRAALKNDPLVELVSFVILRNPENMPLVPEDDLALIPFPVNDIFTTGLSDFDAILFDNFTWQRFGIMPAHLENIANWIKKQGGGFLMMGGENSFGSGNWTGTPVAELLPVEWDNEPQPMNEGFYRPQIEYSDHPLVQLATDHDRNATIWRTLPELEGYQMLKPRAGAHIIARHSQNGSVIIACRDVEKGRTMTIATNTTWRWALQSNVPEYYNRFWKNTVRYLTRSGDGEQVQYSFDRTHYSAGDRCAIRLRIPGGGDLHPRITFSAPGAAGGELPLTQDGAHEWTGTLMFSVQGKYTFTITSGDARITTVQDVLPALAGEESRLGVDEAYLKNIVAATGGEYMEEKTFKPAAVKEKLKPATHAKTAPDNRLRFSPVWLLLLVGALLTEWYLRRRKGLW